MDDEDELEFTCIAYGPFGVFSSNRAMATVDRTSPTPHSQRFEGIVRVVLCVVTSLALNSAVVRTGLLGHHVSVPFFGLHAEFRGGSKVLHL